MRSVMTAIALVLVAGPAAAKLYRLDPDASSISFVYLENGVPRDGRFVSIAGLADFDPRKLQSTDVQLEILSQSVDLGDPVRSHFAQSIDWFHAEAHPVVSLKFHGLRALGSDHYLAEGLVSIKGHNIEIAPEVTLTQLQDGLRASGSLVLNRHDYLLGIGFSSLFATVGTEVTVRFDLFGRAQP